MKERAQLEYRPPFAPHVVGRYPERTFDPVDKVWVKQDVLLECERCKARHRVVCTSGRAREHVARFATEHLHRDPLAPAASSGE